MKFFLLSVLCVFSFICCFSIASGLNLGLALISLVVWLILSHLDVAQLLAFRIACIVMLLIIGVPTLGTMMDGSLVQDVRIVFLALFAIGLIASSVKIHRLRSAAEKE